MIIASNNKGKIKQFKQLFGDVSLQSLNEAGIDYEVEEGEVSFEENAIKKAKEIYELSHCPTLADDSGICIDKLNGFPGVSTHRFLGENATKDERNNYLLSCLNGVPYEDRGVKIYCALAVCDMSGNVTSVCTYVQRKIGFLSKGDNKFGFDEIVEVKEGVTAAMLSDEEKNKVSARRAACDLLVNKLLDSGDKIGEGKYL